MASVLASEAQAEAWAEACSWRSPRLRAELHQSAAWIAANARTTVVHSCREDCAEHVVRCVVDSKDSWDSMDPQQATKNHHAKASVQIRCP